MNVIGKMNRDLRSISNAVRRGTMLLNGGAITFNTFVQERLTGDFDVVFDVVSFTISIVDSLAGLFRAVIRSGLW